MAYNKQLAERIRKAFGSRKGVTEKSMFGGLSFMLENKLCCGVLGEDLMVRVGPDDYEGALTKPGARPMDFTGKPLKGMVYVSREGWKTDALLDQWVKLGADFAASLPEKKR